MCQSFGICTILNTNFYLDHANVFKVLRGDRQTNTQTNISVGQLTLCTKDTNYPLIFGTKSVRCGFYEHHRFGILCWSQNQLPTPSIVNNRSWTLHLPKYLKLSIWKWIRTFYYCPFILCNKIQWKTRLTRLNCSNLPILDIRTL